MKLIFVEFTAKSTGNQVTMLLNSVLTITPAHNGNGTVIGFIGSQDDYVIVTAPYERVLKTIRNALGEDNGTVH